jgi:O-antigen biosynthesis protein WbqP
MNSSSSSSVLCPPSSADAFAKRLFDICSSLALFLVILPLFIVIWIAVKTTSPGPLFHVSKRVGRNNGLFNMFKFRTMRTDTPQVATHLMTDPARYVTPVGRFLRKTSLDELPQLLNVIKGDMAVVGPRPALFNQDDLVALRTERGVHELVPGITGWAQTHGRDEIPIPVKVDLDEYYLKNRSFKLDMYILWLSLKQAFSGENVSH